MSAAKRRPHKVGLPLRGNPSVSDRTPDHGQVHPNQNSIASERQPYHAQIRTLLAGGDRRSTGRADALATDTLEGKVDPGAVYAAIFDEDEVVRMRAADALEKISAQRPGCLQPFKQDLLARLPDILQIEVRWHVAQMLPRLALTAAERRTRAVPVLLEYLCDRSRLVQTFALQALADFAVLDRPLRPRVLGIVEEAARTGSAAVKARCRQLLKQLSDENTPRPTP